MNQNIIVNVLWSGGLDSTYLVVKLLNMGLTVQPYYLIDRKRKSLKKELSAIKKITESIHNQTTIKGTLLDTISIFDTHITPYSDISEAWERLNEKYALGKQYELLSRFARSKNIKLMVGVLMDPRGKVLRSLEGKTMNKVSLCGVEVYTTNEVRDLNQDSSIIYENILFPCFLVGKRKTEEWEELHQLGLKDIAEMTWFCHHPVLGLTCGHCNPCKDALNEGMAFRISKIGYAIGAVGHFLLNLFLKK